MGVDIDRENIKQLLTERNVPVELIEPSNEHKATSPDLAVTLGNQRVLIEVESKNDDEQLKHSELTPCRPNTKH